MRPAEAPVFEAPWQAQAFAMAVLAAERGLFSWAEWTETLGAEIARTVVKQLGSRQGQQLVRGILGGLFRAK